ncbi:MAG: hypothetical protein B7X59_08575 [Polaromonas sp. 39-63-203]|nr:MAG: hypothetical protein B7Y03_08910 [Polaromonas sp. 24-62-144]OZA97079.1 MAG: hypothetical protein B7X59_08575 [Polaromonas sp. 39-63-203]
MVSSSGSPTAGLGTAVVGYSYAAPSNDTEAARFLLQAQFNASDADIAALRSQGYAPWISAQLNASAAQTGVQWLDSRGYGTPNAATSFFDQPYPADFMVWQQLMQSPDGVRKRLALALSEFFVVSLNSIELEWRSHSVARYWDLLVEGTRGNFRQLLEEVTLSPAMGVFLNTRGNQKENAQGRQPDENYAREVMQLFTIGLYQLNPDGSEKRAADGSKLPSYTMADVTGLARVLTGWDLDASQSSMTVVNGRNIPNTSVAIRRMALIPSRHSTLAASFLGATVPANTDGTAALKTALDTLFNHPNVGPFFGKQMIQRLVTSNPSPGYVARVASVFNNNGDGVRGDMKSVFAAILLDDEARSPAGLSAPAFGKLREPMVRLVQWGRTFGLNSAAGSWKMDQQSSAADQLGQSPLRSASVFNFFRPGYVPPSTALATSQQVAPEFQIVNESTVGGYLNFMQDRIRYGFNVDSPGVPEHTYNTYSRDITASYTAELALVLDTTALVNRLNLLLCAGQLSAATRTLMINALNATSVTATSTAATKLDRVCAAVLMVLASPEYLVQK